MILVYNFYLILSEAAVIHYEADEALKAKKHEEALKNVYPDLLEKLNSIIVKNKGHLAAGKVVIQIILCCMIISIISIQT